MCSQERLSNLQGIYPRAGSTACHPQRWEEQGQGFCLPYPHSRGPFTSQCVGTGRQKAVKKSETPAGKKKRTDYSPKPSSKKKYSSKLRDLDEKWGERFARLEAMLHSKTFAVAVKKPSSAVTSDQPFLCPPHWGVDILPVGWTYYFCFFQRPDAWFPLV